MLQSKRLYWEGEPRQKNRMVRNSGELLCQMARSLRVYGDGISSKLSLLNHSDSGSFPLVHSLLNQGELQEEDSGASVGHMASF